MNRLSMAALAEALAGIPGPLLAICDRWRNAMESDTHGGWSGVQIYLCGGMDALTTGHPDYEDYMTLWLLAGAHGLAAMEAQVKGENA